jgi:hypothetical protein
MGISMINSCFNLHLTMINVGGRPRAGRGAAGYGSVSADDRHGKVGGVVPGSKFPRGEPMLHP